MNETTNTQPDDDDRSVLTHEEVVWEGRPSHWSNFGIYLVCILFCWLIVPAVYGLYRFFLLRSHHYQITNQRFKETTGMFTRHREDLELYRVKDISMDQPFLYRMVGLGNIVVDTSDKSNPQIVLHGIDAPKVIDLLHNEVERIRRLKGTREIDIE